MGLLPLHAARYQANGGEVYFQDEFEIIYAPSARILSSSRAALAAREGRAPALAGVGNPLPHPVTLRYARAELEQIAKLFSTRHALYEKRATKRAFEGILLETSYVHLACHGQFDPAEPLESYLQLARGERLTLREILAQDWFRDARLVVLSACQTGLAEFRRLPDEAIGLPAGLFQAGVPSVIGTLWSVNDLSTALLMVKFYEYHLRGDRDVGEGRLPPAGALRKARRWLREVTADELVATFQNDRANPAAGTRRAPSGLADAVVARFALAEPDAQPFSNPYHWAPFILIGE